jgi:hypothetical protein
MRPGPSAGSLASYNSPTSTSSILPLTFSEEMTVIGAVLRPEVVGLDTGRQEQRRDECGAQHGG